MPVEFDEERDVSESFSIMGWRPKVSDAKDPDISALEGTLGSCTISSDTRPLSSFGWSIGRKLELVSKPGLVDWGV